MNYQLPTIIFFAFMILGCGGPATVSPEHQQSSKIQVTPFSPGRLAGHYHLGNGSESKNLYLNLREDSTFCCQWFDYGSRGCAGGEVRGECSGSWKIEGNLIKISNHEQTGNFDARPLGNLVVRLHGIVQALIQTNDREQYDKRQNDQTCFHKDEPNMRRYPQPHEWPELLNILVGSNTQLARDIEPLGVNSIDNRFIFETSTNSILRRKILDTYKLQTVSTTHPLLATLVHSIPDARLRWGWKLEQCSLLATPTNGTAQLDSNPLFAVVDHPESNETIVFIQWK